MVDWTVVGRMRDELVICTKDRPDELLTCLESVARQTRTPQRVVVVESGSRRASTEAVDAILGVAGIPYVRFCTDPGLTLQRNVALDNLLNSTDVVHFVDDDTILEPEYLEQMVLALSEEPGVAGATGFITNLPTHRPWLWRRLSLLDGGDGQVLRSGVNILNFRPGGRADVQWTSGCSMSFRTDRSAGLRFDERRPGNGLGEDVDFSLRASSRGRLVYVGDARLAHVQSPVNRDGVFDVYRRGVHHRWLLASDGLGGVTRASIAYSVVVGGALGILVHVLKGSRYGVRTHLAQIRGLADVLRRRA